MPAASEGMRRAVKCLHGSQMLSEDTIAAMLPEEVLRDGGNAGMVVIFYDFYGGYGISMGWKEWDVGELLGFFVDV